MSLLDELKKWTHPYEDEDEEYDDFEEPVRQNAFEDRKLKVEDRRNKVVNIHATTQLKVVLVKPERFENASEIADHLKDKRTVVLNLESTNKDIARRLIDFLSGVAYAGEGKIKKVAANTYIITPYHVDIEGDLIDEIQAAAGRVDGIVLNPGGYAHTSVAILDALRLCGVPAVEVLLTAPDEREPFRKTDVVSFGCQGHFIGQGPQGYLHACAYLAQLLRLDGTPQAHIVM